MDDELPAGWTDLHLHPCQTDSAPELAEIPQLIGRLGAVAVLVCVMRGEEDLWDASEEDNAEPLLEEQALSLDNLGKVLLSQPCQHVNCMVDPRAVGLDELCRHLFANSKERWQACLASVGWGLTTLPDADRQQTRVSFRCSLAIGGPGVPGDAKRSAKAIESDPQVLAACERFAELLGTPCRASLRIDPG